MEVKILENQMERRSVEVTELRVLATEGSPPVIEGHAAVFNQWSETLGRMFPFKEKVMPGAFRDSIVKDDIRALFNHDSNHVLGRNKAGTLELEETEKGLHVRIMPPDTQWARDLQISISRSDISQMSFGFIVQNDRWGTEDGIDIRELHKVKLIDVSPVTFPAYPQTDVGVRSAMDNYSQHKEAEKAHIQQHLLLQERKWRFM